MLFFNRHKKALKKVSSETRTGYWSTVRRRFTKSRLAVWATRLILALSVVALCSDFIANEKPIYCQINGQSYWPIFKSYVVENGWGKWDTIFLNTNWKDQTYDKVIYPLIPYSYHTLDRKNSGYVSPLAQQDVPSIGFRHWLGTDLLGRDIAAGMIHGTRIALSVGILAMMIAAFIGISLGALAGYFGDEGLSLSRASILVNLLGFLFAVFFAFISRRFQLTEIGGSQQWLISGGIFTLIMFFSYLLSQVLNRLPFLKQRVLIPLDLLVMRLIEVVDSIPGLLLVLTLLALVKEPSIYTVMLIIGLIGWTGIARFVRSELLRIRSLTYIESVQAMGLKEWQILVRHALPNALTPVLITLAFGIAGAILLEAFLSFIGLGIPLDQVSWGSMLNEARNRFSAWWLAIFPGFAIFLTVLSFNLIGEGLMKAIGKK